MNRFRSILAIVLALTLLASIVAITAAETAEPEAWQADIQKLMSETSIPKSTAINYDLSLPEGVEPEEHTCAIEKVSTSGITMRAALNLIATENYSKEDWEALDVWLNDLASAAIQGVAVDTKSLANAVDQAIASGRESAIPEGETPVWARDSWMISSIEVTIPYYPELSKNVNGTATQRLQEKLIQLGYLDDKADGFFGNNTRAAVEMLQQYVRELEQDLIDARPTAEPTIAPIATAVPDSALPDDHPIATEAPTPEPEPTPVTEVNGKADALLQAYLYSDAFKITRGELKSGDKGDAVKRVQNRLRDLGYMTDKADGIYGGSTARSIRIFQYYNALDVTGIADESTQIALFSENAKQPDNQMLASGSKGDAVKTLQTRLRVLGFGKGSSDGDYGANTVQAVKNLQTYMRALEERAVRADDEKMAAVNAGTATIESFLTVEVNGIADPLLLDDFYSDSFPAIPEKIDSDSFSGDVVRLQRRLNALEYYYSSLDGDYGGGTKRAIEDFQKRHKLDQTGIADQTALEILFSDDAKKALKPYVLKVSVDKQRVYAYAPDENEEYTVLVRTMKCSTGKNATPTPKGTFQNGTGPGARWHYFKKFKCWAQYAYYIEGDIMFHSVLYKEKDGPVTQSSVNNLGRKASHGCIRLSVEDAKWINQNCPRNTKIIVY